jgi:hypothetical protein
MVNPDSILNAPLKRHYVTRNEMSVPPNGLTDRRSAVRILVSLSRSLSGALQPFRGTEWYLFCQCQELWRIYRISTIVVQLED